MDAYDTDLYFLEYYNKKKKLRRWIIIVIILAVIAIGLQFRVRDITVLGNKTYSDEQAVDLVFESYWDRSTVYCLYNRLRGKKKTIPFVADYDVNVTGPYSCELIIYEKNPVGCIEYMSNYMYFDKDGIVVESSRDKLLGVPMVEGLKFGYIVLGKALPVESRQLFAKIMTLTQQLTNYEIPCEKMSFDERGNATITIAGADIDVYLGGEENMLAKISVLKDMLPRLTERNEKGTLDISQYNDYDKGNHSIFKRRE